MRGTNLDQLGSFRPEALSSVQIQQGERLEHVGQF